MFRRLLPLSLLLLLLSAAPALARPFRTLDPVALRAQVGYGSVLAGPPGWTAAEYRRLTEEEEGVNPGSKPGPQVQARPPWTEATPDAQAEISLDDQLRSTPALGELPSLPGRAGWGRSSTSNILRSVPVASGFYYRDSLRYAYTSLVGEPSVGGAASSLLFTGNWHAQISGDDGLNWQFLDPYNVFPASAGTASSDRGTCCDQVVHAERGGGSDGLIAWLVQSNNVSAADGNRLRLVTYQGRDELLQQRGYCLTDLQPSSLGYDASTMFDFNQMARSKKWLYISTNVYDLSGSSSDPTKTAHGALIVRLSYSDLQNGDCSPRTEYVVPPLGQSVSPAQGGDASSSLYFAALLSSDSKGNVIRVYRSDDSGGLVSDDEDISDYPASSKGKISCPLPDGSDACLRGDARIITGWQNGSRAGWLWNVAAGSGYGQPHIQGYVYNRSEDKTAFEPVIYNQSFAWIYPAVQLGEDGSLALTAYKAGGGDYTRARSFVISSPGSSSSWSGLQSEGIVSSNDGSSENKWGDYATVAPYPGCENTWAAGLASMQGGDDDGYNQHRFAWLGRSGCPNLRIERLAFLPDTVQAGQQLAVGITLRNSGSASAGASSSRAYLSRDPDYSSADTALGDFSHATVGAGGWDGQLQLLDVPSSQRAGSYYLIVCADATGRVGETTGNDNCSTADELVVVEREQPTIAALKALALSRQTRFGRDPQISVELVTRNLVEMLRLQPVIESYISTQPVWSQRALLLARQIPRPPRPPRAGQNEQSAAVRLETQPARLGFASRQVRPGRYHLWVCLRPAKRKAQASDCLAAGQVNRSGLRPQRRPGQGQPGGAPMVPGQDNGPQT